MSEKSLTIALTKVLCRESLNTDLCPFCENKGCDPKMSETFLREAHGVIQHLLAAGVIKKSKLI